MIYPDWLMLEESVSPTPVENITYGGGGGAGLIHKEEKPTCIILRFTDNDKKVVEQINEGKIKINVRLRG